VSFDMFDSRVAGGNMLRQSRNSESVEHDAGAHRLRRHAGGFRKFIREDGAVMGRTMRLAGVRAE